MVVLDKIRLPLKTILYIVVSLLILLLLFMGGLIYKKNMEAEKEKRMAKQTVTKEVTDRNAYNSKIEEILKSPNIDSARELYNLLYNDKIFYESAGWTQDEVHCTANVCNSRYKKIEGRLFEYVILKKEDISYLPVFNETELTYEGVVYPIDLESNLTFKDKLPNIQQCTDFIAKSYEFNSLLQSSQTAKLIIDIPSDVFSFSKNYEWATDAGMKKGTITFETTDVFMFNLLKEYYVKDLVQFSTLNLKKERLLITLSYYCF